MEIYKGLKLIGIIEMDYCCDLYRGRTILLNKIDGNEKLPVFRIDTCCECSPPFCPRLTSSYYKTVCGMTMCLFPATFHLFEVVKFGSNLPVTSLKFYTRCCNYLPGCVTWKFGATVPKDLEESEKILIL